MAYQYTTVDEKSFAFGIDARSAENQLREGFVRDLVNADIIEGRIKKRKGYSNYAGNIPVRVASLRYDASNKIYFTLDGSIDLSRVESTPILVSGRSSLGAPFANGSSPKYYTSWTANLKKTLLANTTSTISVPATEHGIPSSNLFAAIVRSTAQGSDLSGEVIYTNEVNIDAATYDITSTYTNNVRSTQSPYSYQDQSIFLFYLNRQLVIGETYIHTTAIAAASPTPVPITITSPVHQLSTYSIVPQLWLGNNKVLGSVTSWTKIQPDSFTVNLNNGEVNISVTVNDASINTNGCTIKTILSAVPVSQTKSVELKTGTNNSILIGNVDSPLIFSALYEKLPSTNTYSLIKPDSILYDDITGNCTVQYTNTSSASSGIFCYNYGSIRANELYVTDASVTSSGTDTSPQLTIWGLDHKTIYDISKSEYRKGWVTHLDSYRAPKTTHMVAGLGGNIFAALSKEEMVDITNNNTPLSFQASMPTYYARLSSRVDNATNIGPAFYDTALTYPRTRGYVTFTGGGSNWGVVTGVAYQSGTVSRYRISAPHLQVTGTPIGTNDYLTVKNMSHSKHNGTFKVSSVAYNIDLLQPELSYITIDVINPNITNSDYDDTGTEGYGGVFTDEVGLEAINEFLAGDILLSSSWGEETQLQVTGTSGLTLFIQNVFSYRELSSGLLLSGLRTSDTVALRTDNNTASVTNLVAGDIISYSLADFPLTIRSVNTVNNTITLDETITWYHDPTNTITYSVAKRWVPREMPTKDNGDSLINDQIPRYFANNDYDKQPFLRSAMVQNNLYLTNGDDEVYKYDGQNIYRAGIIPWQPGLFATTQDTTSGGIPLLPFVPVGLNAPYQAGNQLVVSKANSFLFTTGSVYKYQDGSFVQYLTLKDNIEDTSGSGNVHYLSFQEPLQFTTATATATLTLVYEARYAFRLNIKDANGVTIASAVTGADDFVVRLAPPTAGHAYIVHLRLVGLPVWDQYDFKNRNIELQIYRTKWTNSSITPIFYKIATKGMTYTGADGYIDFQDQYGNAALADTDIDPVVSVLSPDTVPAGWDEPSRAKYVTSAGNRLVLANLLDWPTLAITYQTANTVAYTNYNNQLLRFHRNETDTATTTNMIDRVTYELRTTNGVAVSALTAGSPTGFSFTCTPGRVPVVQDWVYLSFDNPLSAPLTVSGWWQISAVTAVGGGVYTCTVKTATAVVVPVIATYPMHALFATAAYDVPVNIDGDANMGMFNGGAATSIAPIPGILRRIGMAINATMRMTDTTLSTVNVNQASFRPWLVARSESDTQGQLIVKQPRADIVTPSVTIIGGPADVTYVNGSKVATSESPTKTPALTTRYPSRLIVSYNNYPEIFDNPYTVNDDLSDSTIDINSSDGQEITGVIPFFGESAFGAALQSGVLVVFKQNSIYLVDLAEKRAGRNPVQRIETQGLGCTAPYSIAPTKDGIAFANDSGIYVLRRNQRIEYLGRFMERNWQNNVDKNYLSIVQGHHYNVGRQYKLSVPMKSETVPGYAENSQVYVYNHTNEGTEEPGGWTRYTNHPATGWANLYQDAFFATANGSVMKVRNGNINKDYRDEADAIETTLEGRATDFGNSGIRKIVSHVVVNYRTGGTSENTSLSASPDLYQQFDDTTPFAVINIPTNDGFSTVAGQDVTSIRHSLVRRKCVYMTVKISNNGIDEDLEIAGMSYVVAGLTSKGITQAATTKAQSKV